MAKNQVTGDVPDTVIWTNATGGAVASGASVVLGSTGGKRAHLGVLIARADSSPGDVANGEQGVVAINRCFRLPKVTADVLNQGEGVSRIAASGLIGANPGTPASGDLVEFGVVHKSAGNGDTTVDVWIDQPGTLTA